MLKRHKKILDAMHEEEKKPFKVCEFHKKRGEENKCAEQMAELCEFGPGPKVKKGSKP